MGLSLPTCFVSDMLSSLAAICRFVNGSDLAILAKVFLEAGERARRLFALYPLGHV